MMFVVGVSLSVADPHSARLPSDPLDWFFFIFYIFGTQLGQLAQAKGFGTVDAATGAVLSNTEIFFAFFADLLMLDGSISLPSVLGAVVIFCGSCVTLLGRATSRNREAADEQSVPDADDDTESPMIGGPSFGAAATSTSGDRDRSNSSMRDGYVQVSSSMELASV